MNIELNSDTHPAPNHDERMSRQLSQIVVGEITAIDTVLQSTGLKVVAVNCGTEILTTASTADNLKLGMKTAFAKLGAVLNDNKYVQIKEVNGIECQGVLCSEYDLGLGASIEGILEIPHDMVNGAKLIDLTF